MLACECEDCAFQAFACAALWLAAIAHGVVECFHDIVVTAAVSVCAEVIIVNEIIAEVAIEKIALIEIEFHRAFGAGEDHTALFQRVVERELKSRKDVITVLRNQEIAIMDIFFAGKRRVADMGIAWAEECVMTVFIFEILILRQEEHAIGK